MSRREVVLLVSRALALLFISSALIEGTYLPERLFAFSHYVKQSSVVVGPNFSSNYYLVLTGCLVLRILAYSLAAALFWKCGARVEGLFSTPQESQAASG
jgi:hypothetical protein